MLYPKSSRYKIAATDVNENCGSKPLKRQHQACPLGDGNHDLDDFSIFKNHTAEEHGKLLRTKKLCYGCYKLISPDHTAKTCTKRRTCSICNGKHPSGLHAFRFRRPNEQQSTNHAVRQAPDNTVKNSCTGMENSFACAKFGEVISMCAVPVQLYQPSSGRSISTYAMLEDTCSQATFMKEELAKQLGVTGRETSVTIKTINGSKATK